MTTTAREPSWPVLGTVAPTALAAARLELHWAAQVIAAVADKWIVTRPDDGHTTMTWRPELGALVGEPAAAGLAIAVGPADLEILAVRGDAVVGAYRLRGHTLAEAMTWADGRIAGAADAAPRAIHARGYDMPAHAVATDGARFTADAGALAELARWYGCGAIALAEVAGREAGATAVLAWPHHFDLGGIVFLDAPGAHGRQIGFGLSPGDGSYAEPYFYVTPYPIPDGAAFPPLASGGHWRREGFTGAILTGTAVVDGARDATAQRVRVRAFLDSALAGARAVIAGAR